MMLAIMPARTKQLSTALFDLTCLAKDAGQLPHVCWHLSYC